MEITNANLIGNCIRRKFIQSSLGIRGIRGISACSPFPTPVKIVATKTFGSNLFIQSLVPFTNLGGEMFLSNITDTPTCSSKMCEEHPGGLRVFKNSTENIVASSSTAVSVE